MTHIASTQDWQQAVEVQQETLKAAILNELEDITVTLETLKNCESSFTKEEYRNISLELHGQRIQIIRFMRGKQC